MSTYKQINVAIKPHIADAFKTACAARGDSIAGTLAKFMTEYADIPLPSKEPDYSIRKNRRKALQSTIEELQKIRDAEATYRDNMPINLRSSARYAYTKKCVEDYDSALSIMAEIYFLLAL